MLVVKGAVVLLKKNDWKSQITIRFDIPVQFKPRMQFG